ncbi:MAG: sirohydrochlorin nickelochelatase [Methanimicrococcus sp.]|nr:sirohydrochlorin nickelochelatase [Methanimicrococcus sp.]
MSVKETLLLVGHGSKLPYSKELLVDLADKIRVRNEFENIEIGLMEFNEPTIQQGLQKAIDNGSKRIIVVPVFLAPGVHTNRDIPQILGLLNEEGTCENNDHQHDHGHNQSFSDKILKIIKPSGKHTHDNGHGHHHHHTPFEKIDIPADVEIVYKKPLGADDKIVDIIMNRILEE